MTVKEIRDKGYLIYEVIAGSKLYGQNTTDSDTNLIGVYVLPQSLLMGGFGDHTYSKEGVQIFNHSKYDVVYEKSEKEKLDVTFYELRYFLKLLKNGTPQAIEILFAPQSHVVTQKEPFTELKNKRLNFITKRCLYSFGYSSLGLYDKIRKLRNYHLSKKLIDFITVLPDRMDGIITPISLEDYMKKSGEDETILTSIAVQSTGIKNIYHLRKSYKLHYSKQGAVRDNKPWTGQKIYPGIEVDENGKLKEYVLGSNKHYESTYQLQNCGCIYFDQEAYDKYVKIKANSKELLGEDIRSEYQYHPTKLAHAFRLISEAIELAKDKTITFPIGVPLIYNDIKRNGVTHSVLSLLFNTKSQQLEDVYDGISDDVDAEWLQSIEIAIRGRHYLLNSVEKHIS